MKAIQSDEQLINQFLTGKKEDSETAFETIIKRHGPMVLGLCRQILCREQDAEDAFQTTFLVLARKAGTIHIRKLLGCWLYEVAYRIAIRERRRISQRRLQHEPPEVQAPGWGPDRVATWNELRPVLHTELNHLQAKYGVPLVLSYLEGETNAEIARLLQCPIGTVKGRLSRARDALRSRLSQRGLDLDQIGLLSG
jgi:RNA polymerase sigma factor (sigma-70 family)